jgi:acetyl-CoA carboxylase biotin carboxyl carrier protein
MDLSQDDVIGILKLIDESPMGRFTLELGDLKLEVVKGTGTGAASAALPLQSATPQIAQASPAAAPAATLVEPSAAADIANDPNLVAIEAPLLGIFYRRSEPGAPPYVEVGSMVDEETTVALIEVMKLFKPVNAGVRGRIEKICVENGALVDYLQRLFLVRIDG